MTLQQTMTCAHAAAVRAITKIRSARRGRSSMRIPAITPSSKVRDLRRQNEAKSTEKSAPIDALGNSARSAARRHAGGREVWRLDDAQRAEPADPLWGGQHIRAIAASALGATWRISAGKTPPPRRNRARRKALRGVGIPA